MQIKKKKKLEIDRDTFCFSLIGENAKSWTSRGRTQLT